jgi:hypothetical protein
MKHNITFKHPDTGAEHTVTNFDKNDYLIGMHPGGFKFPDLERLGLIVSDEEYVEPVPTKEELQAREEAVAKQKEQVEAIKSLLAAYDAHWVRAKGKTPDQLTNEEYIAISCDYEALIRSGKLDEALSHLKNATST